MRNFGRQHFGKLWHDLEFRGASPEAMERPPAGGNRSGARAEAKPGFLSSGRRRLLPHGFLPHRFLPHWPAIVAAVVVGLIASLWFAASLGFDDRAGSSLVSSPSLVTPRAAVTPSPAASPPGDVAVASEPEIKVDAATPRRTPPPVSTRRSKNRRPDDKPRIATQSETELLGDLQRMARVVGLEIDGHSVPASDERRRKHLRATAEAQQGIAKLLAANPQLAELPFLGDDQCRTDPHSLPTVAELSRTVRTLQGSIDGPGSSPSRDVAGEMREVLHNPAWARSDAVRTMTQMMQVESDFIRLELVRYLSKISGPEADRALVDRALFDLSATVREDAVAALKARPLAGYRERLLSAFRHPWPAAARHAAEACVELATTDLLADLEALSKQPDPGLAVKNADGAWMQTEMVRINHLSNCVLCHPPAGRFERSAGLVSATPTPLGVPAAVPTPGTPLSVVYYGDSFGRGVQGDIVYLRQDFSVVHVTETYEPWPLQQRYDYLVRTRPATNQEIARAESRAAKPEKPTYPQREAVLLALFHLKSALLKAAASP